jgi:hypothetical protein
VGELPPSGGEKKEFRKDTINSNTHLECQGLHAPEYGIILNKVGFQADLFKNIERKIHELTTRSCLTCFESFYINDGSFSVPKK